MTNVFEIINKAVDAVQAVGNTIVDKIQEAHPNPGRDKKIDEVQGIINKSIDELQKLTGHVEPTDSSGK
jgi:hypothetical protein